MSMFDFLYGSPEPRPLVLKQPEIKEPTRIAMRRFSMFRRGDISATHTADTANVPDAIQFEGVVFTDGRVAIRWLTSLRSVSVFDSMDDMLGVHGHPEYGSELVWHDE